MVTEFQPYVGPRPFERTEVDQNRFFGRDHEASDLLSRITAHSAVLLYSQSGAGKTSLINAKLIPMLEKAGFEVLEPARVRDVPPEDVVLKQIPNLYVFNVLRSWSEGRIAPQALVGISIPEFLRTQDRVVGQEEDATPRVAIFDQFEELFTSYQDRFADREEFFAQIGDALEEDHLLRVVFAMREDYIAELDPYLTLLPEKLRTRVRLERLSEEDALLAITEPLKSTDCSFAEGVAEQLVKNLLMVPVETAAGVTRVEGESVEPVQLQVVCQSLWENCQNSWRALPTSEKKVITRKNLETFGDVDQALSSFYENAIRRVVQTTNIKEGILRRWFEQHLITSAGTRGTVYRGREETGGIPNAAVDKLVDQHIIRGELRAGGSRWYELTHDRLIGPILKSNEQWVAELAEETRKNLEAKAVEWEHLGRGKKGLLKEEELIVANRWLESKDSADLGYSDALWALVQASRVAAEDESRQRQAFLAEQQRRVEAELQRAEERELRILEQAKAHRRLRWALTALAAMFILAVGSAVFATVKWREAETNAADAREAREKALENERAATDARERAEKNETIAKVAKEEAVNQRLRAEEQAKNAQRSLKQAVAAEAKAKHQSQIAEQARREAERSRGIAEAEAKKAKKEKSRSDDLYNIEMLNREIDELISQKDLTAENLDGIRQKTVNLRNVYLNRHEREGERSLLRKLGIFFDRIPNLYSQLPENLKATTRKKIDELLPQILRFIQEIGDTKKEAALAIVLGDTMVSDKDSAKALEYYRQAHDLMTQSEQLALLKRIVRTCEVSDTKAKAIKYCEDLVTLLEKVPTADGLKETAREIGSALIDVGWLQRDLGQNRQAITSYERAREFYKKAEYLEGEAEALTNIAQVYKSLKEEGTAFKFGEDARLVYEQLVTIYSHLRDAKREANALTNIGTIYDDPKYSEEERERALEYHGRALQLVSPDDPETRAAILRNMATTYFKLGDEESASFYLGQAEALPQVRHENCPRISQ